MIKLDDYIEKLKARYINAIISVIELNYKKNIIIEIESVRAKLLLDDLFGIINTIRLDSYAFILDGFNYFDLPNEDDYANTNRNKMLEYFPTINSKGVLKPKSYCEKYEYILKKVYLPTLDEQIDNLVKKMLEYNELIRLKNSETKSLLEYCSKKGDIMLDVIKNHLEDMNDKYEFSNRDLSKLNFDVSGDIVEAADGSVYDTREVRISNDVINTIERRFYSISYILSTKKYKLIISNDNEFLNNVYYVGDSLEEIIRISELNHKQFNVVYNACKDMNKTMGIYATS